MFAAFHNVSPTDPWTRKAFPSSVIFFNVFCVLKFSSCKFLPSLDLYQDFYDYCEWDYFIDFFLCGCHWSIGRLLVFYVLVLYPATLLNAFTNCRNFLIESLGPFCTEWYFQIRIFLSFFFPIGIPFISFSCLIVLGKTSNTMWSRNGEDSTSLLSWFSRKASCFLSLSMMLAVDL